MEFPCDYDASMPMNDHISIVPMFMNSIPTSFPLGSGMMMPPYGGTRCLHIELCLHPHPLDLMVLWVVFFAPMPRHIRI